MPIRLLSILACLAVALQAQVAETPDQRDVRMAWWREARFGMFIHWGLYAIPAGEWKGKDVPNVGEWIMHFGKIPLEDYTPLAESFNPVKFDARAWTDLAARAGMKYVVITTKHHDGFSLYDSALTHYDVMDATPFRRDIMKEIAAAGAATGLKIGWYHSILDWHHPDWLPRGPDSPRPWDLRPTAAASFDRYIDYMKGQLVELMSNYGTIDVLWFDGGWEHSAEEHRAREIVAAVRKLQPGIVINDRIGTPEDFGTPEQFIPARGFAARDWETCMTMNGSWGFKTKDHEWKSVESIVRNLVDIASKGGNFLLNVGPTADGRIPQESIDRLEAVGRWMAVNGESIHGTTASPVGRLEYGRCTAKAGTLYLHVFDWPKDGKLEVPGLRNAAAARLLGDVTMTALPVSRHAGGVQITVPVSAPDPLVSVVVLTLEGKLDVDRAVRPRPDGSIVLEAQGATLHGTRIQYEADEAHRAIGLWTNRDDWVAHDMVVSGPGQFRVVAALACPPGDAGSSFTTSFGDVQITHAVPDTGSWTTFLDVDLGTVRFDRAGPLTVTVKANVIRKSALMNLRSITLVPIAD